MTDMQLVQEAVDPPGHAGYRSEQVKPRTPCVRVGELAGETKLNVRCHGGGDGVGS